MYENAGSELLVDETGILPPEKLEKKVRGGYGAVYVWVSIACEVQKFVTSVLRILVNMCLLFYDINYCRC